MNKKGSIKAGSEEKTKEKRPTVVLLAVLVAVLAGAVIFLCAKTAAISDELLVLLRQSTATMSKVDSIVERADSIAKDAEEMIKDASVTLEKLDYTVDTVNAILPQVVTTTIPELNQMMLDINYYFSLMASQFTDMSNTVINAPMLKLFGTGGSTVQ